MGGGDVVFRLLCPNSRTGSIIGKGGDVIKHLRDDTGARIKVEHAVPGAEERVVLISAPDVAGAEWSPSQQAAFRVYSRMMETTSTTTNADNGGGGEDNDGDGGGGGGGAGHGGPTSTSSSLLVHAPTVRLLVPSSQIGCLLGKGGCIINQMRARNAHPHSTLIRVDSRSTQLSAMNTWSAAK